MKITAQEEYGLRILIRIAGCKTSEGLSIPQISQAEGLSEAYTAKLTRLLRQERWISSRPGYKGGYTLAQPAAGIQINQVLKALGGGLFDENFCDLHTGNLKLCTNSVDCSARSLWQMIQLSVDKLLNKITLHDLITTEAEAGKKLQSLLTTETHA